MQQALGERTLRFSKKRFGRFSPETEQPAREAVCARSEAVKELLISFRRLASGAQGACHRDYELAKRLAGRVGYSKDDVLGLSVALAGEEDRRGFIRLAGLFLSACVQTGRESVYTINTRGFSRPLEELGFWNRKTIIIDGPSGDRAGRLARKGSLLVLREGAGDNIGQDMTGGTIIAEAGAGAMIGHSMKNGLIIVKGNAGRLAGFDMQGGEIRLEGSCGSISSTVLSGRITHLGVLLVE
ncbi:MAG: hypothetical protein AB1529_02700 [Candidatus Micrarchaeota archaeon]